MCPQVQGLRGGGHPGDCGHVTQHFGEGLCWRLWAGSEVNDLRGIIKETCNSDIGSRSWGLPLETVDM